MNLLEFNNKFKTEQDCINHLRDVRMKQGITCKSCCDVTKHYWLGSVNKFQCSICRSRTNIKSGTIMEKSKVPLTQWFIVIHFMTSIKKSFSSLELMRQLGFNSYKTIWYMMMKIRTVMGKRDGQYKLEGDVEIDEGFFETVKSKEYDENGFVIPRNKKRGRGSDKQSKVLVMVESKPINHDLKHKKKRVMGYVKMIKIDTCSSKEINYEVSQSINRESTVYIDNWRGYNKITDVVNSHVQKTVKPKESMKILPWVHTVISNSKKMFLGIHHSVNQKYLQNYLNEFCYKLNRRNFEYRDSFDGLLLIGGTMKWN
jgi:hypothetical protein